MSETYMIYLYIYIYNYICAYIHFIYNLVYIKFILKSCNAIAPSFFSMLKVAWVFDFFHPFIKIEDQFPYYDE